MQPPVERASRLLGAEIEEQLSGREEENGPACEDGAVRDVLRDHRFVEAAYCSTRGGRENLNPPFHRRL
jgi:hypothetical protein